MPGLGWQVFCHFYHIVSKVTIIVPHSRGKSVKRVAREICGSGLEMALVTSVHIPLATT
jgi:hypothetical protein